MSASRMFLQLTIVALMGSDLTKAALYRECFKKVEAAEEDRCRLAQDAIKCYEMNVSKLNNLQAEQDMNSTENNFELWGCPEREKIRLSVCKNAFYKGTDCNQERNRIIDCIAVFMNQATGKSPSALQKELTIYKRYATLKCPDIKKYFEKKIRSINTKCWGDSFHKVTSECQRETRILRCFERAAHYYKAILPRYWLKEHGSINKRSRASCKMLLMISGINPTKADVYQKCFYKFETGIGDRCRLAQDAIKCYAMNIQKVLVGQALKYMISTENNFERWECPGKENIRLNVCNNAVYNGTHCTQELQRIYCMAVFMKHTTGKSLSALRKGMAKYKRDALNKCPDILKNFQKMISKFEDGCRDASKGYKIETECIRETLILKCFELGTRYHKTVLPGDWSKIHKAVSEMKRKACPGKG